MTTFHFENMARCALRNIQRPFCVRQFSGKPLWFAAAELLGLGRTSATELCVLFGMDPDLKLPIDELTMAVNLCDREMCDETQGPSETCAKMWAILEKAIGD